MIIPRAQTHIIDTISPAKAARGTKRTCHACNVRFYDLGRDPIVCPACAAQYAVVPAVVFEPRAATFTQKTGWRSKATKHPVPEAPVHAAEDDEADAPADADEVAPEAEEEDDLVLEPDTEDAQLDEIIDVPVEKDH